MIISTQMINCILDLKNCINLNINASKSTIIIKDGRQIILANDYAFFTFNKLLSDIDSICSLLLDIGDVEYKYLDSILSLQRGVLEKYADCVNFSYYSYYEKYLNYLNFKSNDNNINYKFIEQDLKVHFNISNINRKTRYYLLKQATRKTREINIAQQLNEELFHLDRELSPKVHNNITTHIRYGTNNYETITLLLFQLSIILQEGIKSMIYYLNLLENQIFYNMSMICENIRFLISNRNVFEYRWVFAPYTQMDDRYF